MLSTHSWLTIHGMTLNNNIFTSLTKKKLNLLPNLILDYKVAAKKVLKLCFIACDFYFSRISHKFVKIDIQTHRIHCCVVSLKRIKQVLYLKCSRSFINKSDFQKLSSEFKIHNSFFCQFSCSSLFYFSLSIKEQFWCDYCPVNLLFCKTKKFWWI